MDKDNQKVRLLFSARDPAAAHAIKNLAEKAIMDERFFVKLMATPPASGMLLDLSCESELLNSRESGNFDFLQTAARKILREFQPDAVVVGASGPDAGIDEILVKQAQDAKTYVVQDFWGDVNLTLDSPADCYLVVDDFAARLTRERVSSEVHVTGSVKHVAYKNLDLLALRAKGRSALRVSEDMPVYGYFGMPLGDFPGYWRTLNKLSESIQGLPIQVMYRPHPKEDEKTIARTVEILDKCKGFYLDEGRQIEETLASCDLILSCYSSCGIDSELLGRSLAADSRLSLFLLFDNEIFQFFSDYTLLDDMPLSIQGRSLTVKNEDELDDILKGCLSPSVRASYITSGAGFPAVCESVNNALEKIHKDVSHSHTGANAL